MDYHIRMADLGSIGKMKHLQSQMNAGPRTGNGDVNLSSRPNRSIADWSNDCFMLSQYP